MELRLKSDVLMEYLPEYLHNNLEFKTIFDSLGLDIDKINSESEIILTDSFIMTLSEKRLSEWEKWLKIGAIGTLEDRRLTILSYFAVISKLTEQSIKALTSSLYEGARAFVNFEDSTIKITVAPLPEHEKEQLDFPKLYNQLQIRKPCHIDLFIERYMTTWGEIETNIANWGLVSTRCKTWRGVELFMPKDL